MLMTSKLLLKLLMLKTKERVIYNNLFNFNIYNYIKSLFTERDFFTSSVRLMVRTLGFHPKNRSSILLRSTMEKLILQTLIIVLIMVTWIGGASAITFDNLRKQGEKSMESITKLLRQLLVVMVVLFIIVSLMVWL